MHASETIRLKYSLEGIAQAERLAQTQGLVRM